MAFWIRTQQDLFFLTSALDLARLASTLPPPSATETDRRQACVLGTVICAVSFLECSINGLYEDARALGTTKLHRALAGVWSEAFDRQPILTKYQIALALAKREPFNAGAEPYQSAFALIELRNAIAHPKELIETERQQKRLQARLNGMYTLNPARPDYPDFFPNRCLSADGSLWAVETATRLVLEFKQKMPPRAYSFPFSGWTNRCLNEVQQLRRSKRKSETQSC